VFCDQHGRAYKNGFYQKWVANKTKEKIICKHGANRNTEFSVPLKSFQMHGIKAAAAKWNCGIAAAVRARALATARSPALVVVVRILANAESPPIPLCGKLWHCFQPVLPSAQVPWALARRAVHSRYGGLCIHGHGRRRIAILDELLGQLTTEVDELSLVLAISMYNKVVSAQGVYFANGKKSKQLPQGPRMHGHLGLNR
jgi:hypothetical protein